MKNLTISNLEVLNIIAWNNQLSEDKLKAIPMKLRFHLKKFIGKILPDAKAFEEFRDAEIKNLQEKYINDDMSYEVAEPVLGDDGKPVLDADGNQETNTIRKIKNDYLEQYQKDVDSLNKKLNELLIETNVYEINSYDIETMVDSLPDDTPLEFEDINILDAIFTDNGEA